MRRVLPRISATAIALACVLVAPAGALPPDFEHKLLAGGLDAPTSMAWAPDGRMFVAEYSGRVRVVEGGRLLAEPLLDISDHVNGYIDRGLLGIAVDADFATNHFLYLLYVYDEDGQHGDGQKVSRLTRVVVRPDNTVVNPEAPETVVLGTYDGVPCPPAANDVDCLPADFASHAIGTVRADPDGTLWVGSGDSATAGQRDPNALRTYDETSLAGKILHIDRDGHGLPGHPFCPDDDDLTHTCTKVYAKGFRNPFRFVLRPGAGPVVGDVGNADYDEINLITPGGDYGWPCWEGPSHTDYWESAPECQAKYAAGGVTPPDYSVAGAGTTASGHAILGGPVYPGGEYPDAFDGDIFYGDFSYGEIWRLRFGAGGPQTELFNNNVQFIDLQLAPNGNLAFLDAGGFTPGAGRALEVVYCPENCAPRARASATPRSGPMPLSVSFSSATSGDPDGDAITYEWDFGDGSPPSTSANPAHEYTEEGVYTAQLTVTDPAGRSDSVSLRIVVGNAAPEPSVDSPGQDFGYAAGEPFVLTGSATDPEDGVLDPYTLQWRVRLHHANHVHPFVQSTGESVALTPPDDHDADSFLEVVLTAEDADGNEGTATRELRARTVPLRLDSTPPGAPVTYGGTAATAPFSTDSAVGFRASVSAASGFSAGGRSYEFDRWSDGGERQHEVTIPGQPLVLTAAYRDVGGAAPVDEGGTGQDETAPLLDRPLVTPPVDLPQLRDAEGPVLRLARGLRGAMARAILRGRALDPSGVRTVHVALRARRGRAARCRWWLPPFARLSLRRLSCASPRWVAAALTPREGGVNWRVALGGPVPAGRYELLVRAVDGVGNVGQRAGRHRRIPFRLRSPVR